MALLNNRWQKDEKVVLERHSQSILPVLLLTVGVIGVVLGVVIAIETETAAFLLGVPFLILGAVLYSGTKMHLTVTTKRVIMDGPFSRYTVLPLQSITAMTAQNNVLHISSAGGHIQMGGVEDARGVCDRVFALLNEENVNDIPDGEVPNRKTWVCVCGMPNDESSRVCRGCGNPRPNGAAPRAAAPVAPKPQPIRMKNPSAANLLGKKWCYGCGAVYHGQVTECNCGCEGLDLITEQNVAVVMKNLYGEEAENHPHKSATKCHVCHCDLLSNDVTDEKMCPSCGRTFRQ